MYDLTLVNHAYNPFSSCFLSIILFALTVSTCCMDTSMPTQVLYDMI